MQLTPERLQRTTVDIVAELARDPGFAGELARARRLFFGGEPDYAPVGEARDAAEGRFSEWFVLERESEHLGAVPVDAVAGLTREVREALRDSVCGLFVVESQGQERRVRDGLTDEVQTLETAASLQLGDVVVGRLYPCGVDTLSPSPVSAILRDGGAVVAALQRDLERAGLDRRLTQAELEAVLFRSASEVAVTQARRLPPERLEARLDSLLREGGDQTHSSAEISAALEAATQGPGPVMGPILEELAFDTGVDLDAVREVMLQIWNEHRLRAGESAAQQPPAAPAPLRAPERAHKGPGLGATIAERIERGLAAHEDIEALFADVEGMLGDDEDDEESDDAEPLGDSEGDLDPLIQEYLWEEKLDAQSDVARTLAAFLAQQQAQPVPGVYLESIPSRDLTAFLLRTYLAAAPAQRPQAVRDQFAALRAFYDWAAQTQCYDLAEPLAECSATMLDPLDRLQRASLALSTSDKPRAGLQPKVLRVLQIDGGEVEVVGAGVDSLWLDVPEAAVDLRNEDLILAALSRDGHGGARIEGYAVVVPSGVAALLE